MFPILSKCYARMFAAFGQIKHSIFNIPCFKPTSNGRLIYARYFRPFCKRMFYPVYFYNMVVPSVILLFFDCCPSAIFRAIVPVYIYSVDCKPVSISVAISPLFKCLIIIPFLANLNVSSAVMVVARIVGIVTS